MENKEPLQSPGNLEISELIDGIIGYAIIIDLDNRIRYISRSFIEKGVIKLGEDVVGEDLYKIFQRFQEEGLPDLIKETVDNGKQRMFDEFHHRTRLESIPTEYRVQITPLRKNDKISAVLLFLEPLGKEKIESALLRFLRYLVVHRIKGHMSDAKLEFEDLVKELVKRKIAEVGDIKRYIDNLRASIWLGADTSDKVNMLADVLLAKEEVNLREVVDRIIQDRVKLQKKVNFGNNVPKDLTVRCSSVLMEEVLQELVQNAHREMPEGYDLLINAEKADGAVVIKVRNTGCTIPDQILKALNDGQPLRPSANGEQTGIGVTIAKLALMHHYSGKAEMEHRNVEGGVTVEMRIPLRG